MQVFLPHLSLTPIIYTAPVDAWRCMKLLGPGQLAGRSEASE
jgi:hypothetical protein